jgi:hypothetical protein
MRLSGPFLVSVLFLSASLLAQHASGGGSSSGGSHGGYSGGSSSSASSARSFSSAGSGSHVASASASSHQSSSSRASFTKASAAPEEKGRSFWHPFRKPVQSAELKRVACFKGSCGVCPRGQSRAGNGACVIASNVCTAGQYYSCGGYNDCSALAQQLAEQKRQMRSQNDFGQSLRYRLLQEQYQQCLMRSRSGFGAYAFSSALLLDTP